MVYCYNANGRIVSDTVKSELDLIMATTKHKGWVNIISLMGGIVVDCNIYKTEKAALETAKENDFCIATTELIWEE